MNLAILRVITNRLGDALESFEAAAEVYGLMDNRRGRALVQSNAAWLWYGLIGDQDRARSLIQEAMEIYEEIGDSRGTAQCLALLGSILGREGRADEAIAFFERCLSLTRDAADAWLTAQALREYGYFELEQGSPSNGLRHVLEAEDLCRKYGMNDLIVGVRALMARLYLRVGDLEAALSAGSSAMKEMRPGIELAHVIPFALAEVYEALGEEEPAARLISLAHQQMTDALHGLPAELRRRALEEVPHNSAIATSWKRRQAHVIEYPLPATDAPLGRPLTPDDHVTVRWTIHHPSDHQIENAVERRREQVLRLIREAEQQGGSPTVTNLADALSASTATIRRDLSHLRKDHGPVATRGSRSTTHSD
jgi:tetratricopeptide (TPR) repeat protein